ncbi:MAG: Ig-like domain-containing protein [Bacteroidetes bacterium]|nr:Ig-like domain-containing protein [Bacteroidota bacterium]
MKQTFFKIGLFIALGFSVAVFNACKDDEPKPNDTEQTNTTGNGGGGNTIAVESIDMMPMAMLDVGWDLTLDVIILPENATNKTVTWTSSDKTKATVDSNGKITAIAEGVTTITAKAGNKTATCVLTIFAPNLIPVTDVSLDAPTLSLLIGESHTLTATITPDNATDKIITWTSSSSAATVSGGKVTAVSAGTATITVRVGNKSATCVVTVQANPALVTDEGVIIDGIKWATRNVDAPGTFTVKPEDAGMFYQWGWKTAWNRTDYMIDPKKQTLYDFTNISDTWSAAEDPCPAGWRVPTEQELESLANHWIEEKSNGITGYVFGSGDATIVLPIAGFRASGNQGMLILGQDGYYWSNTSVDAYKAVDLHIWLKYKDVGTHVSHKGSASSVRCVAK